MKKSFSIMTDQQGFIFPYMMFIIVVVLLLVTASSNMYSNEIHIAKQLTEHLRLNTVYQMGLSKFKEEYMSNDEKPANGSPIYHFPDGDATFSYSKSDNKVTLNIKITLNSGSAQRTIKRVLVQNQ